MRALRQARPGPLAAACLLAMACLLLAGCPKTALAPDSPGYARALWREFQDRAGRAPQAFSLEASIKYSGPKGSGRTLLLFWGETDYPLRLDLLAGFGTPLAYYREDHGGWRGFYPEENTLYTHARPRRALEAIGVGIPLSLHDLALLLTDQVAAMVPPDFQESRPGESGAVHYAPAGDSRIRELTLDDRARPVRLVGGSGGRIWEIALSRHGRLEPGDAPTRVELVHQATEATLYVKKLTFRESFSARALALDTPPGARITPLEKRPGLGIQEGPSPQPEQEP